MSSTTTDTHLINTDLSENVLQSSLANSKRDGFFASVFATLTGGTFLTGFALALGVNEFHIGIIAAIPLCANLFQMAGSYLVSRFGLRKPVTLKSAAIGRGLWIVIAAIPLTNPWLLPNEVIFLSLLLLVLSHSFIAISAVAWLSWISDIVPENSRGRFFGNRNIMVGSAVICFTLLGGKFLDLWENTIPAFQILFFVAVAAGALSLKFAIKIPEVTRATSSDGVPYFKKVQRPFHDQNFRRLLLFTAVWSFAVNFGAPFFVVYKLQDLQLSYTFIAFLISITSLLDLFGMRFWGTFSDRVGNRPVMLLCSLFAAFLPLGWLWTSNNHISLYFLIPLLHIIGGFFWAGMNLTSANILVRLAPKNEDTIYFSTYASTNGLFAALGAIAGGIMGVLVTKLNFQFFFLNLVGLKLVFAISWLLRSFAIPLLRRVQEPAGMPFVKAVQVLRNIRSINSTQGFNPNLHFFIRSGESQKSTQNRNALSL